METPDVIELRKNKEIESGLESNESGPALYTILPQKTVNVSLTFKKVLTPTLNKIVCPF